MHFVAGLLGALSVSCFLGDGVASRRGGGERSCLVGWGLRFVGLVGGCCVGRVVNFPVRDQNTLDLLITNRTSF